MMKRVRVQRYEHRYEEIDHNVLEMRDSFGMAIGGQKMRDKWIPQKL